MQVLAEHPPIIERVDGDHDVGDVFDNRTRADRRVVYWRTRRRSGCGTACWPSRRGGHRAVCWSCRRRGDRSLGRLFGRATWRRIGRVVVRIRVGHVFDAERCGHAIVALAFGRSHDPEHRLPAVVERDAAGGGMVVAGARIPARSIEQEIRPAEHDRHDGAGRSRIRDHEFERVRRADGDAIAAGLRDDGHVGAFRRWRWRWRWRRWRRRWPRRNTERNAHPRRHLRAGDRRLVVDNAHRKRRVPIHARRLALHAGHEPLPFFPRAPTQVGHRALFDGVVDVQVARCALRQRRDRHARQHGRQDHGAPAERSLRCRSRAHVRRSWMRRCRPRLRTPHSASARNPTVGRRP